MRDNQVVGYLAWTGRSTIQLARRPALQSSATAMEDFIGVGA
jgi:hypothetical protein